MPPFVLIAGHPIPLYNVALALGAAYVLAATSFYLGRLPIRARSMAFVILSGLILACPFLVPRNCSLARGVAAVFIILLWMKTWDAFWATGLDKSLSLRRYLAYMLNFGLLAVAASGHIVQHRLPRSTDRRWLDAVGWCAAFAAAIAILYFTFNADFRGVPFLVEHSFKAYVMIFLVFCGFNFEAAKWRLANAKTNRTSVSVFLACSPAEFWRRWNRPVGHWFSKHVFVRVGGTKNPLRATVVTFAVSGLMHEYVIAMFAGRVTGCPTAFCVIQGCAVAATFRFRATGWERFPAFWLTWAFLSISSVLLYAPFDISMPFYDNVVPHWIFIL